MTLGLVGRKVGMTRVFTEAGASVPVTVLHVERNRITQMKTEETDGYRALQVTWGAVKPSRVNKPASGHFAKAGVEAGVGLHEFRINEAEAGEIQIGTELKADMFAKGQRVDVAGTSKGKGFAGTIKRYNFRGQDQTHGNSLSHRVPGSVGQNQTPGRVFKGKKMAGQMGNVHTTSQNLEVVRIDNERNLIMVKGAVPGAQGQNVIIRPAAKGGDKS